MPEIRNEVQSIIFSEIGGTIVRWKYRDSDIFYPRQLVRREGKLKFRGGMHVCFPNFGTADPKFGLPQHGVLRDRKAEEVTENGVIFRGTDLLGPSYDEACEVRIVIEPARTGFVYVLSARLIKPASRDVFINPGFHPYFRTPTGNAQAGAWKGRTYRFYQRKHGPQSANVGQGADVVVPGIGTIQLMLGGEWNAARSKKMYYWRDSRRYLCVEPVFGNSRMYGDPGCLRLTDKWFKMACAFTLSLD